MLGFTQHLAEMITRNYFWGVRQVRGADNLTDIRESII
jgi:hypothetical protein